MFSLLFLKKTPIYDPRIHSLNPGKLQGHAVGEKFLVNLKQLNVFFPLGSTRNFDSVESALVMTLCVSSLMQKQLAPFSPLLNLRKVCQARSAPTANLLSEVDQQKLEISSGNEN